MTLTNQCVFHGSRFLVNRATGGTTLAKFLIQNNEMNTMTFRFMTPVFFSLFQSKPRSRTGVRCLPRSYRHFEGFDILGDHFHAHANYSGFGQYSKLVQ